MSKLEYKLVDIIGEAKCCGAKQSIHVTGTDDDGGKWTKPVCLCNHEIVDKYNDSINK